MLLPLILLSTSQVPTTLSRTTLRKRPLENIPLPSSYIFGPQKSVSCMQAHIFLRKFLNIFLFLGAEKVWVFSFGGGKWFFLSCVRGNSFEPGETVSWVIWKKPSHSRFSIHHYSSFSPSTCCCFRKRVFNGKREDIIASTVKGILFYLYWKREEVPPNAITPRGALKKPFLSWDVIIPSCLEGFFTHFQPLSCEGDQIMLCKKVRLQFRRATCR